MSGRGVGGSSAIAAAAMLALPKPLPDPSFTLRLLGDPILKAISEPVADGTDVYVWLRAMLRFMNEGRGVGFAAPQMGLSKRIIVVALGGKAVPMINPRITQKSDEGVTDTEGCLSIPGFFTTIRRPRDITVAWRDQDWQPKSEIYGGQNARSIAHEIDHLDGIMITDRLPRQQRRAAERLVEKARGLR